MNPTKTIRPALVRDALTDALIAQSQSLCGKYWLATMEGGKLGVVQFAHHYNNSQRAARPLPAATLDALLEARRRQVDALRRYREALKKLPTPELWAAQASDERIIRATTQQIEQIMQPLEPRFFTTSIGAAYRETMQQQMAQCQQTQNFVARYTTSAAAAMPRSRA